MRDGFATLRSISEVTRAEWDALLDPEATPFVRFGFLEALEKSGCAAPGAGWTPRHLTLWRGGRLVAAAPAYVREDSEGDFSRDFDLAGAAARAGVRYYPKLVVTVPFTPATGGRVLVAPGEDRPARVAQIVEGALAVARREKLGTVQVLFPRASEAEELAARGLSTRISFQYHWRNEGYREPEDFLARFRSKARNMLRRERAAPAKQGIAIRTVPGDELRRDPAGWAKLAHALHRSTVEKLFWGRGWLNLAFYERVLTEMPENLEMVIARRNGGVVAGAFNVVSKVRLYGRYWGCFEEHPFLHFNVCLYHSIDECIRRGLLAFEGGAGGEHKLLRGFLPAETFCAHAFLDPRLDRAAREWLAAETSERRRALERWTAESPVLKPAHAETETR